MNPVLAPAARPPNRPRTALAWAGMALFLALAALILFAEGARQPIALWDESRNMVNALEMARSGFSLVTTYGFAPDLWNTKPPLLIWLMTASVHAFGATPEALRLPSALAALATLLILMLFVRRVSGSMRTAYLAAGLLLLSPAFLVNHGPRSADYDALLTFFTTAYLQLLFLLVHRRPPGSAAVALTGALVTLAVLTKSTAGLIPGLGVIAYLLLSRRLARALAFGWAALIVAGTVAAFLLLREAAAPGYLAAAWNNDVLGRFSRPLVDWHYPRDYYLRGIIGGWLFGGAATVGATVLLFPLLRGRARAAAAFSLCIAGAIVAVMSAASTKLPHYILPAYPWLATAAALAIAGALGRLQRRLAQAEVGGAWRRLPAALGLGVVLLASPTIAATLHWRMTAVPELGQEPAQNYGVLFKSLADRGLRDIIVYDDGFLLERWPHYAPVLRAYSLIAEARGMTIRHATGNIPAVAGETLVSCDPAHVPALRQRGRDIAALPSCAAVRR